MLLHYKKYGEGKPLFIMHGVFGMLDNWLSLGKKWSEDYEVYLIDARNHGRSEHSDDMSFESMAEDIKELMTHLELDSIHLLGHSMGGKVAMKMAMMYPELIEKMIVVDIGPKAYPMHHQRILKGLNSLELNGSCSKISIGNLKESWLYE